MNEKEFVSRRKKILDDLGLTPIDVLQSRIHCEVLRCRDKNNQDLVLKILKLRKRKGNLQKEIDILRHSRPKEPLRFPRMMTWGDDYILTRFETATHLDFSDIHKTHIDMIVQVLHNLHQLSLTTKGGRTVWNPGLGRLYFWRMLYWLCYLAWEYLTVYQTFKCIYMVCSTQRYLHSHTVKGHRALGMENLLFDPSGHYITLIDFEHFVLCDNFLYDVVYLVNHPVARFQEWTWQKSLLRQYISEMKKDTNFTVSDKVIIRNLRTTLILVTLFHMGMRRIIDEEDRLFQGMSLGYLLSRITLRVLRVFGIQKPLSYEMGIRKKNLQDVLCENTFRKIAQDLISGQ